MSTYLMISNFDRSCSECGHLALNRQPIFCPGCQYSYWSDDEIAANPDNAHFTGLSEAVARADERYAEAVASADSY